MPEFTSRADFGPRFLGLRRGFGRRGTAGQQDGSRGLLGDTRPFCVKLKFFQPSGRLLFQCGQAHALSLARQCCIALGLGLPGSLCSQGFGCTALLRHQSSVFGDEALFSLKRLAFNALQFGLAGDLG
jgi:hypothetical protein